MRFVKAVAVVIVVFPLLVSAAGMMKPGLWEMTLKSDQMKQMPKIPPEQLERMRKMGVELPTQSGDGSFVHRVCITKEMAERDRPPMGREQSDCKVKNQSRNGSSYQAELVCDGENMKGTGTMNGTFSGDTYHSTFDF